MSTRKNNVAIFVDTYRDALVEARTKYPDQYAWPESEAPIVAERMRAAFICGNYNHDGEAIRLACKRLGIKHTRKAMEAFFTNGPEVVV
jgi:hypothetical protein